MTREHLPGRRASETFDFCHPAERPTRYAVTTGYYEDGRLGDVFVNGAKEGTDLAIIAADASVLLSLALQHGATLDDLRTAPLARDSRGRPLGLMGALVDHLAARAKSGEGA